MNEDYEFDTTEYGDKHVTVEQYKYVADRLVELFQDNDIKKYRMLLVEMGEDEVLRILGMAYIYGNDPIKDLFWGQVQHKREMKKLQ